MKTKLNLIQTIRGLTAVTVVFRHVTVSSLAYFNVVWFYNIFRPSWNGVDIFFVLSGFIITYIHYQDLVDKQHTEAFFIKRFTRIYPVFWIISLIYLAVHLVSKKLAVHDVVSVYMAKSFLLLENANPMPIIRASWSLCFEVLFYLVFGLCIMLGMKAAKFIWAAWLVMTVLCYLFLPANKIPFVVRPYIIEFLMWCLVGYIFKSITLGGNQFCWIKRNHRLILFSGLLLILAMYIITNLTQYGQQTAFDSRIFYGLSASLLILGAALTDYSKPLEIPKIFLLLGDASYVIYLIHLLVLAFAFKSIQSYQAIYANHWLMIVFGFCAAATAVGMGVLFHLAVEKPVLKFLNKLSFKNKRANKNVALTDR